MSLYGTSKLFFSKPHRFMQGKQRSVSCLEIQLCPKFCKMGGDDLLLTGALDLLFRAGIALKKTGLLTLIEAGLYIGQPRASFLT